MNSRRQAGKFPGSCRGALHFVPVKPTESGHSRRLNDIVVDYS